MDKCVYCNKEVSYDRHAKTNVCRTCSPIRVPDVPSVSWSLHDPLDIGDTYHRESVYRRMGWTPEEYIKAENQKRFGDDGPDPQEAIDRFFKREL